MHPSLPPDCLSSLMDWAKCQIVCKCSIWTWRLINRPALTCFCYSNVFLLQKPFSVRPSVLCFFTFSLLLWGSSASSYSCTHFLFFTSSSHLVSHGLWDFFPCSDWFVFMCFHHHHHAGLWLAAVCYVPSCATDLHHLLQWVALSGLWVWALPPQALQPLAGCTGAFPGQVPSTTCVPPHLPTSENSWCSVFLLTCTIQWSASTNQKWHLTITWLSLYHPSWKLKTFA